jgi:hypothetical protein
MTPEYERVQVETEGLPINDDLIEVNYDAETNSVYLFANQGGLRYLHGILTDLLERLPGSHYHLDELYGIEGSVREIVIGKQGLEVPRSDNALGSEETK